MKSRKFLWLLMLTGVVLVCSSWMIEAEAGDDTYNFYFQKAPGPTVVNQGAAGQTASPQAGVIVNPASIASTTTTPEPSSLVAGGLRKWEISLGYSTMARISANAPGSRAAKGQGTLGLLVNASSVFALQGELYYLADRLLKSAGSANSEEDKGKVSEVTGRPTDYSLGVVFTPLRFSPEAILPIHISALAGVISVPLSLTKQSWRSKTTEISHAQSFYYGARVGLALSRDLIFQASLRRSETLRLTQVAGAVAVAF